MPDGAATSGLIGPNALTQLLPLLEQAGGEDLRDALLLEAGIVTLPDMTGLIDEAPVARLHQVMRAELPELAPSLAWKAGERTADYILANRIPHGVQMLLKILPPAISAPMLARAIARNAWTFAGSGAFEVRSLRPVTFAIRDNPVVRGEFAAHTLCHWHAAVFERLFRLLVDDRLRAREAACCAMGERACVFVIARP
ncbi:MAG: bacteriochlorophyll 4-vinyl reductase [Alphaproteobacteria bacterium]|jgi:divinyl protochlorophyllide a 8-vinyl-reductase|nr:bacteriochlorophyll 4-vinyl reductase [Alphaproteobacteria bacterium]